MDSVKGQLLISSARLYDDSFRHTVVLVGEHDAEGAVGVILNRALEVTVQDTIPALGELGGRLFEGGPVDMDQAVILAQGPGVDLPVFGDVGFITGEVPYGIRRARVFLGHAGWGPGQLDAEVAADAWILEDADEGDIFTDSPDTLWPDLLKRKGPPYDLMARIPFDPTMN